MAVRIQEDIEGRLKRAGIIQEQKNANYCRYSIQPFIMTFEARIERVTRFR
jgi:predicted component of type VI protein secretion system